MSNQKQDPTNQRKQDQKRSEPTNRKDQQCPENKKGEDRKSDPAGQN